MTGYRLFSDIFEFGIKNVFITFSRWQSLIDFIYSDNQSGSVNFCNNYYEQILMKIEEIVFLGKRLYSFDKS